jgi:hypothetical protein
MLKQEATQYPNGRSDDLLMALWFLKWNYRSLRVPSLTPQRHGGWGAPAHLEGATW